MAKRNGTNGAAGNKGAKSGDSKGAKTRGTPSDALIPESQLASAPDEFQDVFGERVAGWWALVPGNVIQGILRDSFEVPSRFARESDGKKKEKVYKIEVTAAGCLMHPAASDDNSSGDDDGDEAPTVKAQIGDLVGVDEKGFLKSLARISAGQEVWIGYRGKEPKSIDFPQGRHVFVGPKAKPAKVNPVTGEVTS
jgi:hypothetical protein